MQTVLCVTQKCVCRMNRNRLSIQKRRHVRYSIVVNIKKILPPFFLFALHVEIQTCIYFYGRRKPFVRNDTPAKVERVYSADTNRLYILCALPVTPIFPGQLCSYASFTHTRDFSNRLSTTSPPHSRRIRPKNAADAACTLLPTGVR